MFVKNSHYSNVKVQIGYNFKNDTFDLHDRPMSYHYPGDCRFNPFYSGSCDWGKCVSDTSPDGTDKTFDWWSSNKCQKTVRPDEPSHLALRIPAM
jgi:hypothetical protein